MAQRGRSPNGGVFGYAFGQDDLQPPDSASSGESLLTATEQMGLGQFFKNPDESAVNNSLAHGLNFGTDTNMSGQGLRNMFGAAPSMQMQRPQQWSADQQIASYSHMHGFRPQSAHQPQPHGSPHNHNHMVIDHPLGTNLDESGHMGANALFSLAQKTPTNPTERNLSQRRYSEFAMPQHMRPVNHGPPVLGAMSYTMGPPAGPNMAHANHMPAFTDANGGRASHSPTTNARGERELPLGLQFDTDASFTSSGHMNRPRSNLGYDASQPEHFMSAMMYPGAPPLKHTPPGFGRTPQFMRTQSREKPIKTEEAESSADAQAIKRRRTLSFPAQTANRTISHESSSPVLPATKMDIVHSPGASASSPSGSNSDNIDSKAGGRRRTSTNAAQTAAQAANSKRLKLSDKQRKENHIQSEKRRRAEMKKGYDALDKLVPSLKAGGLSKAQILQQTVVFLESLVAGNRKVEHELALNARGAMPPVSMGAWGLTAN